jgi:hypothetical protein
MAVNLGITNTPLAGIHDYQELVLGPLLEQSKVLPYVRTIQTLRAITHIPTGKAATSTWTAEHGEITQSDDLIDEITVTPPKVASLAVLSNELVNDTNARGRSGASWSSRSPTRSTRRSSKAPGSRRSRSA